MKYCIPTKIYFGNGSLNYLEGIVKGPDIKKIFLVTGKNFIKKTGLLDKILKSLKSYDVFVYDQVNPVPKFEEIGNALKEARRENPNLIIGIGGGSVLDTAKIISIMLYDENNLLDYINNKKEIRKYAPLIAIPTTAGTGSEVTPFAVFYHNNKKQSFGDIEDYSVFPDYAIVDPDLTVTMPQEVIASSGLDALSQALESYWSVNSNTLSVVHAIESIDLVLNYLEHSYKTDIFDFKEQMCKASLEAGLAFGQTATTAPHAISYPMTAHFKLSHGFACALTLPEFLLYNYNVKKEDCLDKRGNVFIHKKLDYLVKRLELGSIQDFYNKIKKLMEVVKAPLTLKEAGINNAELIIEESFAPERMQNNPRLVTKESLMGILNKIA